MRNILTLLIFFLLQASCDEFNLDALGALAGNLAATAMSGGMLSGGAPGVPGAPGAPGAAGAAAAPTMNPAYQTLEEAQKKLAAGGFPYDVPEYPATAYAKPPVDEEAEDLDMPVNITSSAGVPESSQATPGEAEGEGIANSPISPELMEFLKKSVADERKTLAGLQDELVNLRKELKTAREKARQDAERKAKLGMADQLTLALQFPKKAVEDAEAEENEEENEEAGKSEEGKPAEEQLKKTTPEPYVLKPLPVVYITEDARTELANAVQNVLEEDKEDVVLGQAQILQDLGEDTTAAAAMAEIQSQLNKLAAKREYWERDLGFAQAELESGGSAPTG